MEWRKTGRTHLASDPDDRSTSIAVYCAQMYQILVILAVLATVSAFLPTGARQSRTTSLSMAKEGFARSLPFLLKPKNLDGMIGGEAEFDPLGFAEIYDVDWLREAGK